VPESGIAYDGCVNALFCTATNFYSDVSGVAIHATLSAEATTVESGEFTVEFTTTVSNNYADSTYSHVADVPRLVRVQMSPETNRAENQRQYVLFEADGQPYTYMISFRMQDNQGTPMGAALKKLFF